MWVEEVWVIDVSLGSPSYRCGSRKRGLHMWGVDVVRGSVGYTCGLRTEGVWAIDVC